MRRYPNKAKAGEANGYDDATRHMTWSANLAQKYGPVRAATITNAHESKIGVRNDPAQKAMDQHNNRIGIEIGRWNPHATPQEIATMVQERIDKGDAMIIKTDPNNKEIYIGSTENIHILSR